MDRERRQKCILISPALLYELLTVSEQAMTLRCIEGLPPDAVFVAMSYDAQRNAYVFVFESATWEKVEFGAALVIHPVYYKRYDLGPLLELAETLLKDDFRPAATHFLEQWRMMKDEIA